MCSRDDDASDSSLTHSSEMGQSSGTCGRGTARRDSASQQPDSSKEWMFQGIVAVPNLSEVDWDDGYVLGVERQKVRPRNPDSEQTFVK